MDCYIQDSFQVYRETQEQASSCRTEDWKLALWVNHSKNARFRVLDLPELPMVLNLPKQFALSVCSVRLRQSLLHKELVIKSKNVYMSVVGVFHGWSLQGKHVLIKNFKQHLYFTFIEAYINKHFA